MNAIGPDLAAAADAIAARGGRLGAPLHLAFDTGSTNDDAKAAAKEGAPHGAVWAAEMQSRGRGRHGRAWISPPGDNLLFSVLLRIPCAPARVPPIALVAGLAVRDAVARCLGERGADVGLKWPNDVVVRSRAGETPFRKVAGILVESALSGMRVEHVVIGIGVNVHGVELPLELATIATSIAREGGVAPDRGALLADVLVSLERDVEHVAHRGLARFHARLEAADALLGRFVQSEDGTVEGLAAGIDPDGRLIVRRSDGGLVPVASGELRLRL